MPLLTAMITSAAAIWALSFVAYSFIFNYLDRWVKEKEKDPNWVPDDDAKKSFRNNQTVFVGFVISGGLAFGTIAAAVAALISEEAVWLNWAVAFYGCTLVIFAILFVNEIRTSVGYVRRRLKLRATENTEPTQTRGAADGLPNSPERDHPE